MKPYAPLRHGENGERSASFLRILSCFWWLVKSFFHFLRFFAKKIQKVLRLKSFSCFLWFFSARVLHFSSFQRKEVLPDSDFRLGFDSLNSIIFKRPFFGNVIIHKLQRDLTLYFLLIIIFDEKLLQKIVILNIYKSRKMWYNQYAVPWMGQYHGSGFQNAQLSP